MGRVIVKGIVIRPFSYAEQNGTKCEQTNLKF